MLIKSLHDRRPGLPVLVLAASDSRELALDAMRAGASDYLVKPVAPERLLEALSVNADRTRLKQVLLNLLSNAVKYNREGGHITLSLEQTPEAVKVRVADTGIGIEPEHLPSELAGGGGESAYLKLPYGLPLREVEKEYILATLGRLQNNKARTAQALGISEKTLYNKLYRYSGRGPRKEEAVSEEEVIDPDEIKVTGIG